MSIDFPFIAPERVWTVSYSNKFSDDFLTRACFPIFGLVAFSLVFGLFAVFLESKLLPFLV